MPWIPDRASFDDEQTRIFDEIVEDTERSWWIKGYAGTGKTMLLVHLANEYLREGYECAFVTYMLIRYMPAGRFLIPNWNAPSIGVTTPRPLSFRRKLDLSSRWPRTASQVS